jgi:putative ABC transport system substrate-binding protein
MTRVERREFVVGTLALLAAPLAVEAQQAGRIPRIGVLTTRTAGDARLEGLLQGLHELGYVEGRNLLVEYRDAEGKTERFPALAAELVALKCDVIVTTGGTLAAQAAKQATTTLPIVFASVGDAVAEGLVTSLARPGGNVTGLTVAATELVSKELEVIKQAVPGVNRVAFLLKPDAMPDSAKKERLKAADVAARALGVRLHIVETRGAEDFDRAFSDMTRAHVDALTVPATQVFNLERRRLVNLAAKHRLPAVYPNRDFVDAGGLMSYGPNLADMARRAATYVDKILKGAKPADLPVEQPTKFELVINLKTAKALGLTIPPSVLARADEVIQ